VVTPPTETKAAAAPAAAKEAHVQEHLAAEDKTHQSEPSGTSEAASSSNPGAPKKRRSILGKLIHQLKQ